MGLLDQLAGQVLGSLNGNTASAAGDSPLLQIAASLLQGQGGLGGLLQQFQAAGLGEQAASWVGTGRNLPIDASQLTEALGSGQLGELAARFGINPEQLSAGLAQVLPQFVDGLTPHGNPNEASDLLSQGLSAFGSVFGKA
ncbi:YidB family protein [Uliginosibacterium sp. H1]|uniref:YidB family protein n=1 Tax=Uliginosibacterium sp. H1 TaxID=3114757 RepID=UPI002E19C001|nr:YidB family protein [Uliginosibacterium sp. H1]